MRTLLALCFRLLDAIKALFKNLCNTEWRLRLIINAIIIVQLLLITSQLSVLSSFITSNNRAHI